METICKLFGSLLAFVYHCFDRNGNGWRSSSISSQHYYDALIADPVPLSIEIRARSLTADR